MRDLEGRTAVVTGGGSGIGRALVLGLGRRGMRVVVADIEAGAAESVATEARAAGVEALACPCDVADYDSVRQVEAAAVERFGSVELLCNNAGVLIMADIKDLEPSDWQWVFSVNVMGVVHATHAFLPGMLARRGPAHILNTASVASLGAGGAYGASKAAVLAISESLRAELAPSGIGVSALLPASISSRITSAQRNRSDPSGRKVPEPFAEVVDFGIDPAHAAERGIQAVLDDRAYAFVFPEGWQDQLRPQMEGRHQALLAALDRGGVPDGGTAPT